jgi:hypothetical protein
MRRQWKEAIGMLILKRLAIWLSETFLEIWLFGGVLICMFGYDRRAPFGKTLGLSVGAIALLSFTTGYLVTTVVARGVWRSRKLWSYPIAATVLFLIHAQIFFNAAGGSAPSEKLKMRLAGSCVVFACTFAGSVALRRWSRRSSEPAGLLNDG